MDSSNENVTVTCTILGENFNLRCEKNQKLKLEQAIATLQEKAKELLRDSPTITPTQAAILVALDTEHRLAKYLDNQTPFQKDAKKLIDKIKGKLQKV